MDNKTRNDLLTIVRALSSQSCAKPFSRPVDPIALNIPDYFEIIPNPMDLSTVKKKLLDKVYKSVQEFMDDMTLMIENCRRYNIDPRNPVRILGEQLQTMFEFQWQGYQERLAAPVKESPKEYEPRVPSKREKPPPKKPVVKKPKKPKKPEPKSSTVISLKAMMEQAPEPEEPPIEVQKEPEIIETVEEKVEEEEVPPQAPIYEEPPIVEEVVEEVKEPEIYNQPSESVIKLNIADIMPDTRILHDAPPPEKLTSLDYIRAVIEPLLSLEEKRKKKEAIIHTLATLA